MRVYLSTLEETLSPTTLLTYASNSHGILYPCYDRRHPYSSRRGDPSSAHSEILP